MKRRCSLCENPEKCPTFPNCVGQTMAKPNEPFSKAERAAIRAIFIAIKRAWNADSNTGEEAAAIEELIDAINSVKDFP